MGRLIDITNNEFFEFDSAPVTDFPFTFGCWFRADSSTSNMTLMAIANKDVTNYWTRLFLTSTNYVRCQTRSGGGNLHGTTSNQYTDGQWHHALGVWASDTSRVAILDGDYGDSGSSTSLSETTGMDRLSLGRLGDSTAAAYFDGGMAEVAIWNVALAQAEGEMLAKGISPLLVRPQSLILYMPLNMPSGDELDYVGLMTLTDNNTVTATDHPRVYNPTSAMMGVPSATTTSSLIGGKLIGGGILSGRLM